MPRHDAYCGRIKTAFAIELRRRVLPALALFAGVMPAIAANVGSDAGVRSAGSENRWLLTALNVASVLCFALWWWWMNRKSSALPENTSRALVPFDAAAESEWKARALAAEARADKAAALLKARLMPQLARWMMGELVQRLLHQRTDLMSSQQKAEAEVAELEQRLEKLHAPLEDRLKAYERRIAELEKELAAKGEENRELIKAKIDTARRKLASERAKGSVEWN